MERVDNPALAAVGEQERTKGRALSANISAERETMRELNLP